MAAAALDAHALNKAVTEISSEFFHSRNRSKNLDYIGLEQQVDEFLRLRLPHGSDILNPAAGPGLLSAMIQQHGYTRLDAHDDDCATLQRLMRAGLYCNYIGRRIAGLHSSGIKDDTYDAVLMAGGFSPNNISPMAINELLRITKPEGHILFTIRKDYRETTSDFALLEANLETMQKSGKCRMMNDVKITDRRSGLAGRLYIIKKLDAVEFNSECVPGYQKLVERTIAMQQEPAVREETEGDLVVVEHYSGHVKLVEAFFKLRLRRDVEILDVSVHDSHPGLVGHELAYHGYECVDGIDSHLRSLDKVRELRLYRNYIVGGVEEIGSIPVNEESYDVILMAGGFAPTKIRPSAFPELLRVLRPGGYILWTMRDLEFGAAADGEFAMFDIRIQDLINQQRWELLVGPVMFESFDESHAGRFYMLRKCFTKRFALGSPRGSPSVSPTLRRRAHASGGALLLTVPRQNQ